MKSDGYRTIVSILEFPELELNLLAAAADAEGMNGDEYFWIFLGVDLSVFSLPPIQKLGTNNLRLLAGAAMLSPLEGFQVDHDFDRFIVAWKSQDASFSNRVNAFHPIAKGMPGYYKADDAYFQSFLPESGAGFMYDAVMSIGLGACLAAQNASRITGDFHLQGIRSTNFTGASGRVKFGDGDYALYGRKSLFVTYGVVNIFHLFALETNESKWKTMLTSKPLP